MSATTGLECTTCGATYEDSPLFEGCTNCASDTHRSNPVPTYDYSTLSLDRSDFESRDGGVWAHSELLPVSDEYRVSIGEGDTPLTEVPHFADKWDIDRFFIKDESQNPTWSYKDRLCSVAISKGVALDTDVVTISSTGNHGASTAAYAAKAGLECVIFTIPEVPETMKTLMGVYGANVIATPTPEDRWKIMNRCIEEFDWYPTGNYVNPPVGSNTFGIEGYKSIAFEICANLDWQVPDWIIQPTAYGDGLAGIWRGFKDLKRLGLIETVPKMVAAEPFGPLKNALDKDLDHVEPIDIGSTIAFSIGANLSTHQALETLWDSDGTAVTTDDQTLREIQHELGAVAGMYAEASGVAGVAGAQELHRQGKLSADDVVVSIGTSTGLKDTKTTAEDLPEVPTIEPTLTDLRDALQTHYETTI